MTKGKITSICFWCGKEELVYPSIHNRQHFCSRKCAILFREFIHMFGIVAVETLRVRDPHATLQDILPLPQSDNVNVS